MLAGQRQALAADQAWTRATRESQAQAALQRDTTFAALQDGGR
jgi:hypothetical protein